MYIAMLLASLAKPGAPSQELLLMAARVLILSGNGPLRGYLYHQGYYPIPYSQATDYFNILNFLCWFKYNYITIILSMR